MQTYLFQLETKMFNGCNTYSTASFTVPFRKHTNIISIRLWSKDTN